MNKIPTAEEFLRGKPFSIESIHSNMIQFTKLHVEENIKRIIENPVEHFTDFQKHVIKLAYPLINIK